MSPVTVLLLCYRLPSLSLDEFRTYCEEKHVPLVKSMLGSDHPLTHTRYYVNKDSGYVMGSPAAEDADLVAIITYEDDKAMQQSMQARMADGVREKIEADEDKFMDRSRVKVVRLGSNEIGRSTRNS